MKWVTLVSGRNIPENIKSCLEEQPARSGFYNWLFVHKGEIRTVCEAMDDLENYDVVQMNVTPLDMAIIPSVRAKLKNSSTKLVLNNDYVCEFWGKLNIDPYAYDNVQKMGDMVFGTEPHQVSNMINGTFCMPHPSNVKCLKHLGSDEEDNSMGFIFHWWAGKTYLPNRTMDIIKKKFGLKRTRMYGWDANKDEMGKFHKIMFDEKESLMRFPEFAQKIQQERCVYDPNPCHTYGRNGVELACFKKPIVGSDRVFSYNLLTPQLTCDPYDNKTAVRLISDVLEQKDYVQDAMDRAYEEVEYFNYNNSRERYKKALDVATDRGGTDWYAKNG